MSDSAAERDAKRARRDRVSSRMGELLLKGFTMLADACPECNVRARSYSLQANVLRFVKLTTFLAFLFCSADIANADGSAAGPTGQDGVSWV